MPLFDLDRFVADARAARAADPSHKAMREVVARAVSDPAALMRAVGEPARAGVNKLYCGPDLTIINLVWGPRMTVMPHDHRMWAVIGVYTGREDNIYWRRVADEEPSRVEAATAQSLGERDAVPLGQNIIHSVTNPLGRLTGAIHVYGGDFFAQERSEWNPETLVEERYNVAKNMALFEQSNALHSRTN